MHAIGAQPAFLGEGVDQFVRAVRFDFNVGFIAASYVATCQQVTESESGAALVGEAVSSSALPPRRWPVAATPVLPLPRRRVRRGRGAQSLPPDGPAASGL